MNLHRDHKLKVIKLPCTLREDKLSHKSFEFNLTEKITLIIIQETLLLTPKGAFYWGNNSTIGILEMGRVCAFFGMNGTFHLLRSQKQNEKNTTHLQYTECSLFW